eukprot:362188-Chlamydomonas_euryale.AAC.4
MAGTRLCGTCHAGVGQKVSRRGGRAATCLCGKGLAAGEQAMISRTGVRSKGGAGGHHGGRDSSNVPLSDRSLLQILAMCRSPAGLSCSF